MKNKLISMQLFLLLSMLLNVDFCWAMNPPNLGAYEKFFKSCYDYQDKSQGDNKSEAVFISALLNYISLENGVLALKNYCNYSQYDAYLRPLETKETKEYRNLLNYEGIPPASPDPQPIKQINPAQIDRKKLEYLNNTEADRSGYYFLMFYNDILFNEEIFKKARVNNTWILEIEKNEAFNRSIKLIFTQYKDLAQRLSKLYNKREEIIDKFGFDSNVSDIDNDIKLFSALGMRLNESTKQFFELAKQLMLKQDILAARTDATRGLKTFSVEIDRVAQTPNQSLEQNIDAIEKAVAELNKAMSQ